MEFNQETQSLCEGETIADNFPELHQMRRVENFPKFYLSARIIIWVQRGCMTIAKLGVVDANCQVHGVSNLFLAGSSVFPTGGFANPTLTIVALAVRLADYVKSRCF